MLKKKYPAYAMAILALAFMAASCGSGTQSSTASQEGTKLPPGTTEEMVTQTTGSGNAASVQPATPSPAAASDASGPGSSADLAGGHFTVVKATRPQSNANAISSGQREVPGDYLEVELSITNVGQDLLDLSQFSFRIWNPGIAAEEYEDYYGSQGLFGTYVSENMISAVLLDYANLKPAAYKLKMGETADQVFLFFDINPKNVARNEAVTKEGTNLVIHKQRGDNAGEEAEINLAGYPD
jgi:hypothetical protein